MAAKLAADKSIKREIQLRIFPKPVIVTVNVDGVTIGTPRHKPLFITWGELVTQSSTPPNVPAKFYKKGFEYLSDLMKK